MELNPQDHGVSRGYRIIRAPTRAEKDQITNYLNDKARKRAGGPLSTPKQLENEGNTCKAVLGHFSDRPGQLCGAGTAKNSDFCGVHLKQKQRRARYDAQG